MNRIFAIILTLIFNHCFSQVDNFNYPKIESTGKTFRDFIPTNWRLRDSVSGDFNKDNLKDVVLVVETKKPFIFEDKDCFSTEPFFPKMLIVCFKNPNESYRLSTTSNKLFGSCNWGIQGGDPFDNISERRNTFGITFLTGGTARNFLTYYFRFQNNDWYLIGAESLQYWAGHTDGKDAFYNEKINLITGVKEIYHEDQKGKRNGYKTVNIGKKSLAKLADFTDDSTIIFGNK